MYKPKKHLYHYCRNKDIFCKQYQQNMKTLLQNAKNKHIKPTKACKEKLILNRHTYFNRVS